MVWASSTERISGSEKVVTLRDVPEERTVAGVPGRLVGPREAALVDAALVHAAFAAPHGTEAHAPS